MTDRCHASFWGEINHIDASCWIGLLGDIGGGPAAIEALCGAASSDDGGWL